MITKDISWKDYNELYCKKGLNIYVSAVWGNKLKMLKCGRKIKFQYHSFMSAIVISQCISFFFFALSRFLFRNINDDAPSVHETIQSHTNIRITRTKCCGIKWNLQDGMNIIRNKTKRFHVIPSYNYLFHKTVITNKKFIKSVHSETYSRKGMHGVHDAACVMSYAYESNPSKPLRNKIIHLETYQNKGSPIVYYLMKQSRSITLY